MRYIDMDNILWSNFNSQDRNRKKQRRKRICMSNSGNFVQFSTKIRPLDPYFSMNSMELDLKYALQHDNWS